MRQVQYPLSNPAVAAGPIFADVASSSGYQASLSNYSWTHPGSTPLPQGGVVVTVGVFLTGTVTSVLYGGAAMVFVRADTNGLYRNEIWRLEGPQAGSQTVEVTLDASLTSIASAVTYFGVSQNLMVEAHNGANGSNSTPTASVTTLTAQAWVASGLATAKTTDHSVYGLQRERTDNTGALGTGAISDQGPVKVPAATSMSWDATGIGESWAVGVISLAPFVATEPPRQAFVNFQDPGLL